jgi:alpha-1,2-mannosyltransferase
MTSRLRERFLALVPDLRLPVTAALLVTGCVRLLLSVRESCAQLRCDDFGRFWYATSGWWESGRSLYAFNPASPGIGGLPYGNLNLPHTHVLFLPLAVLPRDLAAGVWLLVGGACVVATLMLMARECGWRPTLPWMTIFVWWMPTHLQAVMGQVAWVLMVLVALAWAAGRRDRQIACGGWLGAAIAVKPFLAPMLLWLVWRGATRAVVAACVSAAVIVGLGLAGFGLAPYVEWTHGVSLVSWYGLPYNASLWASAFRLLAGDPAGLASVMHSRSLAYGVAGALCVVAAAVTVAAVKRLPTFDDQWNLVLTTSLLVCPLGWVYYGALLLPGWRGRWPGWLATACWLVPTPWVFAGQPSPLATMAWGSAASWGLLLIWIRALRPS